MESCESTTGSSDAIGSTPSLHRHLGLFDLIAIGMGATIGSGIFVLCGVIAHDYAGPATFISWGLAGMCASASGLCYAELSGKMSNSGSSYAYVVSDISQSDSKYVFANLRNSLSRVNIFQSGCMGRLPSVFAAACLTLEFVGAAGAVSRSWGDKVVEYIQNTIRKNEAHESAAWILSYLDPGYGLNPMAFVISVSCITLLLNGVKESKRATNFFTSLKIALVLFMSFGALAFFRAENLNPLIPAQFGVAGIFRGSTSSFFGYIGFDDICCMAGEAVNPTKNLPRAVLGTIALVTALYMFAAITLVGMVPYEDVSVTSAFPDGFHYNGCEWAAQITAIGELVTLPIVVLVSIMAQPRLQFAMAVDGLLPPFFGRIDEHGNLWHGTLISGFVMVVIATCVPFTMLDDLISAGTLLAFSLTDTCILLIRHSSPRGHPRFLEKLIGCFYILALSFGLLIKHIPTIGGYGKNIVTLNGISLIAVAIIVSIFCPKVSTTTGGGTFFEAPFVPYLPFFGIALNFYLIGQLEARGLILLVLYLGLALLSFLCYGVRQSITGSRMCESDDYDNDDEEFKVLTTKEFLN